MKVNSKILLIFMLSLSFLSACKKEEEIDSGGKDAKNETNLALADSNNKSSKKDKSSFKDAKNKEIKNLKYVDGAKLGSLSTYVEDREIWKDFSDDKYQDSLKRDVNGLHLPRILLDSEDAKVANEKIDALVKEIKDKYKAHKDDLDVYDTGFYSSFSVYQDENVLSVMIENYDIWSGENSTYTIFNFSLPDAKFISDDELMKDIGVEKEDILGIVEDSLINRQDMYTKLYSRDITDFSYVYSPNNYTGMILNDLWDNYKTKNNHIYLDELGNPNFVFDQFESLDMGYCPRVLKLKADKFDNNPLSSEYIRMARKLGIDPKDKNHKAFVIYLGGCFDEASLKESLEKLEVWIGEFYNYEDPNMLMTIKDNEGGGRPYLNGNECYLIIPKYKNASVSLKELEATENGKLKEVDNVYLDNNSCSGTTFICQNISEIAPNAKISIRYRDDKFEFSPSISQKDGSLMLKDGVTDAGAILDWDKSIQKDSYSYWIFEIIKSLMGVG